jgi:hypothetical protein
MKLLTQNSDLKKTGIYGWTLPAHNVILSNGTKFNTCPSAGVCGAFCYAKNGTYNFPNVKKAHLQKLELVLYTPEVFECLMLEELKQPKYKGKYIRIHDAGDFFSYDYACIWLRIAEANQNITFYTYTKEVVLFKFKLKELIPSNFIIIYSFGGKEDEHIDRDNDRHSDVFMNYEQMIAEGYNDIGEDDKQSAIHPNHRVGLYRNNIPAYIRKMKRNKFSEYGKLQPETK